MVKKYTMILGILTPILFVFLIFFMINLKDTKTVDSPQKIKEYAPFNENTTLGFVIKVSENSVLLDISDWAKRTEEPENRDDYSVEYKAKITENTIIRLQNGKEIGINDISKNHIVEIKPPLDSDMISNYEGEVDEIIVLD